MTIVASTATPKAAWGTLVLMVSLSIMSMVDRFILALLVKPLRADLGVTDVQLALLFGTIFAFFYATVGIPIARLADRTNRVRLLTVAVILWSLCTIGSGFATTFEQLLALRAGLALGEAALFPTVHSLLFDLFDARRRLTATAIYTASPAAGGALAYIAGGPLIAAIDAHLGGEGLTFATWQLTFFAVGIPSLLLGVAFGALVREPERHARTADAVENRASLGSVGATMLFVGLFVAAGTCQMVPYAYQAWGPTLLMERDVMTVGQAGPALGFVSAVGSISGAIILPMLILQRHERRQQFDLASLPMLAVLIAVLIFALAPLQDDMRILLAAIGLGSFLLVGTVATLQVAVQRLAPDRQRATLAAGALFVMTIVGLGIGPLAAAKLAESIGLRQGLSLLAVISGLLAIAALLVVAAGLRGQRKSATAILQRSHA